MIALPSIIFSCLSIRILEKHVSMLFTRLLLVLVLTSCGPAINNSPPPVAFDDLIRLTPDEIAECDVGRLNLICAQGLPGVYDDLDVELQTLDRWSDAVQKMTNQHIRRFHEHPEKFQYSEGYFRMLVLITVLQQDFQVRYNPDRDSSAGDLEAPKEFFANSADVFIHGLLDTRLGTCSSMPVLYVAVGRRLGYPLKLVSAKSHLFARWDAGVGSQFNIEGTNRGLVCHDDDYYKNWPRPMTPADLASGQYLKSLTPAEELAVFMQIRGICLQVKERFEEAKVAFDRAVELVPTSELYARFANQELLTSRK